MGARLSGALRKARSSPWFDDTRTPEVETLATLARQAMDSALADRLDRSPDAYGAAAQATLFQLGRWQLAAGQGEDLLLREAWKPWLEQHPDAIGLRIRALRALGRDAEADAEQARLDRLKQAPQLDLGPTANAPQA